MDEEPERVVDGELGGVINGEPEQIPRELCEGVGAMAGNIGWPRLEEVLWLPSDVV